MPSSLEKRGNWIPITVDKSDTGSAIVAEPCLFGGVLIATDGTNKPTITIHDNASAASGEEVLPENEYGVSAEALQGAMPGWPGVICDGLYLTYTDAGSSKMTVYYRKISDL